jgi:hypothetical protein
MNQPSVGFHRARVGMRVGSQFRVAVGRKKLDAKETAVPFLFL